jgi:hypothetical protein
VEKAFINLSQKIEEILVRVRGELISFYAD